LSLSLLILVSRQSHGQGTFRNLDFELANVPFVPSGQFGARVSITSGLPGWTGYFNGQPSSATSTILHNNLSLAAATIGIMGPQWFPAEILQGQYTAYLMGDFNPSGSPGLTNSTAIGETGQIPSTALSLRFFTSPGALFEVTFDGMKIPVTQI